MHFILDNMTREFGWLALATSLCLGSVGLVTWTILTVLFGQRASTGLHPFELQRRAELRKGNAFYRITELLVDEITWLVSWRKEETLRKLSRSLVQARETLPWHPNEYFALKTIEGFLVAIAAIPFAWILHSRDLGIAVGLIVIIGYGLLSEHLIASKAKERAQIIRSRLPYAVDLIALMMEAGGGFLECLETFVEEGRGHPLAEEFAAVIEQIELGRPRSESLEAMKDRVGDRDLTELVFAINKGDELGTPISAILRDQADQMRLKRSQWGEKAAAEAGVKVVFPGMLIVVACLLVVLAPFVMPIIQELQNFN